MFAQRLIKANRIWPRLHTALPRLSAFAVLLQAVPAENTPQTVPLWLRDAPTYLVPLLGDSSKLPKTWKPLCVSSRVEQILPFCFLCHSHFLQSQELNFINSILIFLALVFPAEKWADSVKYFLDFLFRVCAPWGAWKLDILSQKPEVMGLPYLSWASNSLNISASQSLGLL